MSTIGDQGIFEGEKLQGPNHMPTQIAKVVKALIKSIDKRFSDVEHGILEATKIADLKSWPPTYEDATDFGDDHLATMLAHPRFAVSGS